MQARTAVGQLETTLKEKEAERKQCNTKMLDLIAEAKGMKASGGQAVKGLQEAVAGDSGAQSFESLIVSQEKKMATKEKNCTFYTSMKEVVDGFKTSARDSKCCPLCSSALDPGTAAERKFLEQLVILTQDAEENADPEVAKKKIEEYQSNIHALKKAQAKKVEAGLVEGKAQSLGQVEDELKDEIERKKKESEDAKANETLMQENLDRAEHVDDLLRELDIVGLEALEKSIASDEKELSTRDASEVEPLFSCFSAQCFVRVVVVSGCSGVCQFRLD